MEIREELLQELKRRTNSNEIEDNELFTANSLSTFLSLSRNTTSQYLNDFVKSQKVVKINSRPVYFFDKKTVEEKWGVQIEQNTFDSIAEFLAIKEKDFEKLIGYDGSLENIVEQCKAAISYPSGGLPILLLGATGTGKSFIASLIYEYACHKQTIKNDGKFIAVNCSEYANNPELLTANLFGHVKGAYTGAEDDQVGLIALANNGILFLDEVHCLKAECQEKLFQFMDKGIYHRVGDNKKWYQSNCRIIFATTENPQTCLLKTLLRRIPFTVSIPTLKDRPLIEKREIIYSMFKKESNRIQSDIYISNLAFQTLLEHEYIGNIGELENVIKAICAKVFLKKQNDRLEIRLIDLPEYFFKTMKSIQIKAYKENNETLLHISDLHRSIETPSSFLQFYSRLIETYTHSVESEEPFTQTITRCKGIIQSYVDFLFFEQEVHSPTSNEEFFLKMLDKIYSIMTNKYSLSIPNSKIKIYSKLFLECIKNSTDAKIWTMIHKNEISELQASIQQNYPRAYRIASEIIENVVINLDAELDDLLKDIIALSIIDMDQESWDGRVGLILCHGYSTASSMSDTANHMLEQHIFDGIDMELKISIDRITQLVDNYLKERSPIQEIILLVDMGSLEEIHKRITPLSECNIGLINNVSTATVIEVGNWIKQGKSAKEIVNLIQSSFSLSTHFIEGRKKEEAIITVCATGFGSAKKICELLIASLPKPIDLNIIPYDYQSLLDNGKHDSIFSNYDVKLIVGTLDPNVEGIEYMGMENIIAHNQMHLLDKIIGQYLSKSELETFNTNIMKNFTLSNIVNQLTILNAQKVMDDVEEIVEELEQSMHVHLSMTIKVGLYVHISCLIERLILRQEITYVEGIEEMFEENKEDFKKVKDAFSGVEMRYSVEIPQPEIGYILNYFQIAKFE